jgi:hypothetical protein
MRPVGKPSAVFHDALEQRHMQAGDRGEGQPVGIRHRHYASTSGDDGRLGRGTAFEMANNRIAGFDQEIAGCIVPPAQVWRRGWIGVRKKSGE